MNAKVKFGCDKSYPIHNITTVILRYEFELSEDSPDAGLDANSLIITHDAFC